MSTEQTAEERFARYLEARDQERREARNAAIRAMTEDERKLLHNAAVMGFVHGNMHGSAHPNDLDRFPTDLDIIVRVLDACATQEEKAYPFLTPLMKHGARPEPTWVDVFKAAKAIGFAPELWMPGEIHWGRRDETGAIKHQHGWVNAFRRSDWLRVDLTGPGRAAGTPRTASLTSPTPAEVLTAARLVGLVGLGGDSDA